MQRNVWEGGRRVLAFFLIWPSAICSANRETQEKIAHAAGQIDLTARALASECEYVSVDDPYEKYKDYGYHVRGYLREGDLTGPSAFDSLRMFAPGIAGAYETRSGSAAIASCG